jgi:diaminopimelate epimerase
MSLRLPFAKFQGAGNDFVIVDGRPGRPAAGLDWAALAAEMCDRHYGIGSDGLLIAVPADQASGSLVRMRMFNPDGSESEMCGNGLRCFARWLADLGELPGGSAVIDTGAGPLRVTLGEGDTVAARMGAPRLPAERDLRVSLPDGTTLNATPVSMGNPHAVFFTEDVEGIALETVGPQIETHPLFPRRTNVEFVQRAPELGADHLRVRVWERGAGITLACGTGACAAMVAAHLHGLVGARAVLHLPGGELDVQWDGAPTTEVTLSGAATRVFDGTWRLAAHSTVGGSNNSDGSNGALVGAQKAAPSW